MKSVRPWMTSALWAVACLTATAWVWRSIDPTEVSDPADLVAEHAERRLALSGAPPIKAHDGEPEAQPPGNDQAPVVRLRSSPADLDIFRAHSWYVPPPPPPPTPPPAPAAPAVVPRSNVAPPPPFVVIGRMDDGSNLPKVFINQRESLQVVGVGDVIDATYRIDTITSSAMSLTYLPTQQSVTLPVAVVPR